MLQGTSYRYADERLIEANIPRDECEKSVFAEDHLFDAPSAAAVAVLGRNANGWTEWKDAEGRTLDELKRQATAAPDESQ